MKDDNYDIDRLNEKYKNINAVVNRKMRMQRNKIIRKTLRVILSPFKRY